MGTPAWLTRYPVAHRGLHNERRLENTLPAFEHAVAHGFAVELDVRITADGKVAVFHDAHLERLTHATGPVADMEMSGLSHVRFRNAPGAIPSLDEALDTIGGRRPVFIELKTDRKDRDRLVDAVLETVARHDGPVALMSFDHGAIHRVRKLAPEIARGLVVDRFGREENPHMSWPARVAHRHLLGAIPAVPHFVAADIGMLPASVPMLLRHFLNVRLFVWTVRTDEERALAAGWTDQIIFEEPPADGVDALREIAHGLDDLLSPEM